MDELSTGASAIWQHERVRGLLCSVVMLVLATAMLSGLAIANRSALPFPDSRSYWVGGYTAVRMATSIAGRLLHVRLRAAEDTGPADHAGGGTRKAVKAAAGVRSVFYSLFVYVIGITLSLWGVVVAQSLAVAWIGFLLARAMAPHFRRRDYLWVVAGLCLFTSVPWITAELMPDVFTGLVAAVMVVLFLRSGDLPRGTYVVLAAFLAFAISTHASHFPLALALLIACLAVAAFTGMAWSGLANLGVRIGIPIALAIAGTLAVSMVGFHQLSLTPQSPPFLLARSLEDGPGRLLLRSTCPASGYEMCRHLDRIPEKNDDFVWNFIWAPTSLYMTATPQVRDRIRREELPLVLAAAGRYPLQQATASLANLGAQLGDFAPTEFHWGGDATIRNGAYVSHLGPVRGAVLRDFTVAHYVAMITAIGILVYALLWAPGIDARWRQAILLLAIAVLANAVVCSVLSEPAPRYEARVTWLVVAVGLIFTADRLGARSTRGGQRPGVPASNPPQAWGS